MMKKSILLLPATYFVVCEALVLLYELGLAHKFSELVGIIAGLLVAFFTFPASSIGIQVQLYVAERMGFAAGNTVGQCSFWPRVIGMQSGILICTISILFAVVVIGRLNSPKPM